jgi:hypothetical protein
MLKTLVKVCDQCDLVVTWMIAPYRDKARKEKPRVLQGFEVSVPAIERGAVSTGRTCS